MTAGKPKTGRFNSWWFLAAALVLYAAVGWRAPDVAGRGLDIALASAAKVAPALGLVLVLLFLAELLVRPRWAEGLLGRRAGLRGWLVALIAGVLSVGPAYAWYTLLAGLQGQGMRQALAAVFLYARAVKLPLLPIMVHYFGMAYTVTLTACLLAYAVASGLLMEGLERRGLL